MSFKEIISKDLFRYSGKRLSFTSLVQTLCFVPGFRFIYFFRKMEYYTEKNKLLFLWYRFWHRHNMIKYGIQISRKTKIGFGLYIGHFGNIVVSSEAVIGKNCNLSQGVTIGKTNRGKTKGAPKIGNSVWIGTNAVIVGEISIGDNVLIAPLSFVNVDVPSNSIVFGNPAKIIGNKTNAVQGYINNLID